MPCPKCPSLASTESLSFFVGFLSLYLYVNATISMTSMSFPLLCVFYSRQLILKILKFLSLHYIIKWSASKRNCQCERSFLLFDSGTNYEKNIFNNYEQINKMWPNLRGETNWNSNRYITIMLQFIEATGLTKRSSLPM